MLETAGSLSAIVLSGKTLFHMAAARDMLRHRAGGRRTVDVRPIRWIIGVHHHLRILKRLYKLRNARLLQIYLSRHIMFMRAQLCWIARYSNDMVAAIQNLDGDVAAAETSRT